MMSHVAFRIAYLDLILAQSKVKVKVNISQNGDRWYKTKSLLTCGLLCPVASKATPRAKRYNCYISMMVDIFSELLTVGWIAISWVKEKICKSGAQFRNEHKRILARSQHQSSTPFPTTDTSRRSGNCDLPTIKQEQFDSECRTSEGKSAVID